MGASDAERARRSRRHRTGDHTLCDPERCDAAVTIESRGQKLYREVSEGASLSPADLVLLEEAARITDRLDRLDAQLAGGEWLRMHGRDDEAEVVVIVDKALTEARQQATALKQILAELRQSAAPTAGSGRARRVPASSGGTTAKGVGGLGDLTARIAAGRRRQA